MHIKKHNNHRIGRRSYWIINNWRDLNEYSERTNKKMLIEHLNQRKWVSSNYFGVFVCSFGCKRLLFGYWPAYCYPTSCFLEAARDIDELAEFHVWRATTNQITWRKFWLSSWSTICRLTVYLLTVKWTMRARLSAKTNCSELHEETVRRIVGKRCPQLVNTILYNTAMSA